MTYIEITDKESKKLTGGVIFNDINGQPYVFASGFVAIIRPSREKEIIEPPVEGNDSSNPAV